MRIEVFLASEVPTGPMVGQEVGWRCECPPALRTIPLLWHIRCSGVANEGKEWQMRAKTRLMLFKSSLLVRIPRQNDAYSHIKVYEFLIWSLAFKIWHWQYFMQRYNVTV